MDLPKRKNVRLEGYDYSTQGAYFVTICTSKRRGMLSRICRGDPCGRPQIELSRIGEIAKNTFSVLESSYPIQFDCWVIMPNHIHFVVFIPERQVSLGRVIGGYKSMISNEWLKVCKNTGIEMGELWQRNYYEHIIRNDQDLNDIREYIENNPAKWEEDKLYFEM